jgi:hypothetical protein
MAKRVERIIPRSSPPPSHPDYGTAGTGCMAVVWVDKDSWRAMKAASCVDGRTSISVNEVEEYR